jgi:SHS2 domain-containing protein
MAARGWRSLDHTADLELSAWAESEEALLAEAARALVAVMTGSAPPAPDAAWTERTLSIEALDAEDRLVRWLNEVLYLAVHEGFLVRRAAIALSGTGLTATVAGEPGARARLETELKSVTYHDLRLERSGGRWRARFVVDV